MYLDFELPAGQKAPPPVGWQRLAGKMEIRPGFNVGRSTENFVVIDLDNRELISRYETSFRDRITTVIETPSGGRHYWHSGRARNQQNEGWDVRAEGGYVLIPPSQIKGVPYRYLTPPVSLEELKPFPPEILKKVEQKEQLPEVEGLRRITRAKAYATTVRCVEHHQAHNTLFRLVCWMRDLGLSQCESYAVLLGWNATNCVREDGSAYPWSTRELEHKLADAYR